MAVTPNISQTKKWFVTEFKALICSFIIEKHELHQVVMEARPTILSERGTHAYQTSYPRDT